MSLQKKIIKSQNKQAKGIEGIEELQNKRKKFSKMAYINPYLSSVKAINFPIKKT